MHLDLLSDDLPAFLMKLSSTDLLELKSKIEENMVPLERALYRLYTVHAFKGMESAVTRVAGDLDLKAEPNLSYVALTRGQEAIYVDPPVTGTGIGGAAETATTAGRSQTATLDSNPHTRSGGAAGAELAACRLLSSFVTSCRRPLSMATCCKRLPSAVLEFDKRSHFIE